MVAAQPFAGTPVYQTMWASYHDGYNWEMGTGHQCNDTFRYWFWAVNNPDWVFTPIGQQLGVSNGVQHTFTIERVVSGPGVYDAKFKIDGTLKGSHHAPSLVFESLHVVLESYCQGCGVTVYNNSALSWKWNSSWNNWVGQDGWRIDLPQMCRSYTSDTVWASGENANCWQ